MFCQSRSSAVAFAVAPDAFFAIGSVSALFLTSASRQQSRSGYQLPERSRGREAIDFIAFVLPVIFLSPFSSAKSHVKPRNQLNR
jgi:hypothetical protein